MKKITFLLLFVPYLAFSQTSDLRFVSVRGVSEKYIEPDWLELTIVFNQTENIKKENELQLKESELKRTVKSFNIDLKYLKVDNFFAKRNAYYKSSSNKVRMSKSFKLHITDIDIVDSLIIELFKIGANEVLVTNLHNDKVEKIKLEAIKEALSNAKIKAETMTNYLGVSLGEVLEVKEYNPEYSISEKNNSRFKMSYGARGAVDTEEGIGIRKIKIVYMIDVKYQIK